jgi:pectate lyase
LEEKKMMKCKNNLTGIWLMASLLLLASCAQQKIVAQSSGNEDTRPVAFPGAEGFGKYTTGGRGGKVYIVSNLEDDGPGSLRDAIKSSGPRFIVFSVSGTIRLKSPLSIKTNTTIAGQTAPGDGICIADHPVSVSGDNVILRFIRFRMGDRYQDKGKVNGSGHDDALTSSGRKNIIIDHCSISWSTDEVFSVYNGDSTTLQWNLISEPLNYSYHFEKGDTGYENHGYGAIWGGKHLSAHHNLFAHCISRTPRFNGTRQGNEEFVDYRNNVLYNWGHNNVYGGEGGNYSIVNNYYRPGPLTGKKVAARIANPSAPFGKYYVSGNYVEASATVTGDNSIGVHITDEKAEGKENVLVKNEFPTLSISAETAEQAYASVLVRVGAIYPKRDTLDQRIINDVKNKTGRAIDVQGGYPHGTAFEQTLNAWPELKSAKPLTDTDQDGMPDSWEKENGLNASVPDANGTQLHRYYNNIEVYINQLVK